MRAQAAPLRRGEWETGRRGDAGHMTEEANDVHDVSLSSRLPISHSPRLPRPSLATLPPVRSSITLHRTCLRNGADSESWTTRRSNGSPSLSGLEFQSRFVSVKKRISTALATL